MKKEKIRKPLDLILFFVLGIGVGIAFGMSSALLLRYNRRELKKDYKYETVELTDCNKEAKLYYKEKDRNVYLYCLNSIKVKDGNNLLELKNYYSNHKDVLDKMVEEMEVINQYEDGGTSLYQDSGKLTNQGLAILKCSTLEGNKDIYIGPKNMKYNESFCNSTRYIIRNYMVQDVEVVDEEYINITINDAVSEMVVTAKIASRYASLIEKGKSYDFSFRMNSSKIEDNPEFLFENSELISVTE